MPDVFDTILDAPAEQQSGDIFDQVLAEKKDIFDEVLAEPVSATPETDKALEHTKAKSTVQQAMELGGANPNTDIGTVNAQVQEMATKSTEPLLNVPHQEIKQDDPWSAKLDKSVQNTIGEFVSGATTSDGMMGLINPFIGAGQIASAVPHLIGKVHASLETPANSPERWQAGADVAGFMAMMALGSAAGKKALGSRARPNEPPATPARPVEQVQPQATVEAPMAVPEPVESLRPPEAGLQEPMPSSASMSDSGMPAGEPITQRFQEPTGPPVEDAQMAGELGLPVEPLISETTGQPIPKQATGIADAVAEIERRNAPEPVNLVETGEFAQEGYTANEPAPAPKLGVSKIGQSIQAKAVEAKLTKGFEETAGYDPITIADQAVRATDLVKSSLPNARAVIRGEAPLPEGLRGTSLITAMEEHLVNKPNPELAYELANSPLTTATSVAAQEMRLMAERVPDSITAKFQEIRAAREAGSVKRGESPAKVAEEIKTEIVKNSSKRPTWEAFARSIECV